MSTPTTKHELKRIIEGVLYSLDVPYSLFDVAEGPDPGDWKVTFFDRNRSAGRRIFCVSLTVDSSLSEDGVKEQVRSHLEKTLVVEHTRVERSADEG